MYVYWGKWIKHFVHKAECISDSFTKWEIISFLLSKCIIWGSKNAKIEVKKFIYRADMRWIRTQGFNLKVSQIHYETHLFDALVYLQVLHHSQFAAIYTFANSNTVFSVKRLLLW